MVKKVFDFTYESINELKIPTKEKGREVYEDEIIENLLVIVSYGGSKRFYYGTVIGKKYYRIKIGNFPNLLVAEARIQVIKLKDKIANGYIPIKKLDNIVTQENVNLNMSFEIAINKYYNDYAKYNVKNWKSDLSQIEKNAKHLYNREISSITRDDIQNIFNKMSLKGKYSANRFLAVLGAIFNKFIDWELVEKNPTKKITKHKEKERARYLLEEEIPVFLEALKEVPTLIKDFVLISIYTAARKSNVLAIRWKDIHWDNKTLYIPDTKNGEPHVVPLLPEALEILERRRKEVNSEWVFPSSKSKSGHFEEPKKWWDKIRNASGLKDLRIHDLRRTLASWMANEGTALNIIGKALNHKSLRSTQRYARLQVNPVRTSMEKALEDKIPIINSDRKMPVINNSL
ncbi:MAG TPA: tyrosine-type recombinase/integrase [Rickettsia endosymbiont of Pyrocoelia pectoralis]|nr:tyrosine-type recombinase/integrase [Rickettsia endosymbiont of Pyrocoelia pectoralis]